MGVGVRAKVRAAKAAERKARANLGAKITVGPDARHAFLALALTSAVRKALAPAPAAAGRPSLC